MITYSGINFIWVNSTPSTPPPQKNSVTSKVDDLVNSKSASQLSTLFELPSLAATHVHDSDTDSEDADNGLEDRSSTTQPPVSKKRKRTAAASTPEEQSTQQTQNKSVKKNNSKKTYIPVKCRHFRCPTTESVAWRYGPEGRKTLCNACGIYYSKFVQRMLATPPSNATESIDIKNLII